MDIFSSDINTIEVKFEVGAVFAMGNTSSYWRVLDIDESAHTAIVISDKPISKQPYIKTVRYNSVNTDVSWQDSYVREWLNGSFYDSAFSESEKEAILDYTTEISNTGLPVRDKIWLLNKSELAQWIDIKDENEDFGWIRTTGRVSANKVPQVFLKKVSEYGATLSSQVRPALLIDLNSKLFNELICRNNGTHLIKCPSFLEKNGKVFSAHKDAETVFLPITIRIIEKEAFLHCKKLKSVFWDGEKLEIKSYAFDHCPALTEAPYPCEKVTVTGLSYFLCPNFTFPAKLYLTEERLSSTVLSRIPRDAEAVAHVLSYQKIDIDLLYGLYKYFSDSEFLNSTIEKTKTLANGKKDIIPLILCGIYVVMYQQHEGYYIGDFMVKYNVLLYKYKLAPEPVQRLANEIEHSKLMEYISKKMKKEKEWYAAYAAYANDEELSQLITDMKKWPKQKKEDKLHYYIVRGAIILNSTETAKKYFETLDALNDNDTDYVEYYYNKIHNLGKYNCQVSDTTAYR